MRWLLGHIRLGGNPYFLKIHDVQDHPKPCRFVAVLVAWCLSF